MKTLLNNMRRRGMKIYAAIYTFVFSFLSASMAVLAKGDNNATGDNTADEIVKQITGPINTLINVFLGILAAVGTIMLIKAITDLINAIQQQDNSGIFHAGRSIAVAILMMSISLIVAIFTN